MVLEGGAFGREGFPGGSDGKASDCNVGDLEFYPGEGNGNPL